MALIFLDLDGTLTDPKPGITGAVIHALTQLRLAAPTADELEWVIGPPLHESLARLGAPDPQAALALYRAHYAAEGMFDCRVYDGIPQALHKMRYLGHRLFLATAKPHIYAKKITAHFGLNGYLEDEFGPELDGTRNDKGDLLAYALDQLGETGKGAIMIGDRANDLAAARANDMQFIGVPWGYGNATELAGADKICNAPDALPDSVRDLT